MFNALKDHSLSDRDEEKFINPLDEIAEGLSDRLTEANFLIYNIFIHTSLEALSTTMP